MILIDKILTLSELRDLKVGDKIAHVFPRMVVTAPPYISNALVISKTAQQLLIKRDMPEGRSRMIRWSLVTGRPVGDKASPARLASIKDHDDV